MKNRLSSWFTFSALSLLPLVAMGQAPNLGTASSFALFTAVGAFDNLGTTVINGDIGTNVGAFTGFPPGVLTGSAHVADPTSAQVAIDVNTAYDSLVAAPCDTVIGVLLGNGQILPPRVYCLGAASTLAGDLLLDGRGDPNAVFIIKIDGALSTSTFSSVSLIGSATWCNVYWQINGAFSLGDSSVFRGTIITNGAMTLLESSAMDGRGLSKAGAIELHNNAVANDCFNVSPLPIELVSFDVNCEYEHAVLNWSTSSEINNDFFSLERSSDGVLWQLVGTMKGAGNSTMPIDYSFTDSAPLTQHSYYRLKQTNVDGSVQFSDIISFSNCEVGREALTIYPNPTQGSLTFYLDGIPKEFLSVSIYNAVGILIYHSADLPSKIDLSHENAGVYFVAVQSTTEQINGTFSIIK